jgi:hypothetical protein
VRAAAAFSFYCVSPPPPPPLAASLLTSAGSGHQTATATAQRQARTLHCIIRVWKPGIDDDDFDDDDDDDDDDGEAKGIEKQERSLDRSAARLASQPNTHHQETNRLGLAQPQGRARACRGGQPSVVFIIVSSSWRMSDAKQNAATKSTWRTKESEPQVASTT